MPMTSLIFAAFIFADAGYDVWLGNMRGNTYGKQHTHLDPNGHDFWKFRFVIIGTFANFDIPVYYVYYIALSANMHTNHLQVMTSNSVH